MTGCARTSTTPLDADTIEIAVRVGAICDGADADRLARWQAAVETLRRGFDDFIVVDSAGGDHVADYAPVTARTNLYGHTGTLFREDAPLLAHRRVLTIRMLHAGEDDSGESLSARAVLSSDRETVATGRAIGGSSSALSSPASQFAAVNRVEYGRERGGSENSEHPKADGEHEGREQADGPSDGPELGAHAGEIRLRGERLGCSAKVRLRGEIVMTGPGGGAGGVHDGFRHRFIDASFPQCLDGGMGIEGRGVRRERSAAMLNAPSACACRSARASVPIWSRSIA